MKKKYKKEQKSMKYFRKAQIAFQFMIAIAVSFMFFTMLLIVFNARYSGIADAEIREGIKDISLKIKSEIRLASSVGDGYSRDFNLPEAIMSKNYTINSSQNYVIITSGKDWHMSIVPFFNGYIKKGVNTINVESGSICINC